MLLHDFPWIVTYNLVLILLLCFFTALDRKINYCTLVEQLGNVSYIQGKNDVIKLWASMNFGLLWILKQCKIEVKNIYNAMKAWPRVVCYKLCFKIYNWIYAGYGTNGIVSSLKEWGEVKLLCAQVYLV